MNVGSSRETVELAIGQKVLTTELDIASGAGWVIVDITLEEDDRNAETVEGDNRNGAVATVHRWHACVLVKPDRPRVPKMNSP